MHCIILNSEKGKNGKIENGSKLKEWWGNRKLGVHLLISFCEGTAGHIADEEKTKMKTTGKNRLEKLLKTLLAQSLTDWPGKALGDAIALKKINIE